jgi:membrane-anchored protein YejM (alkaline phosphatase superfamily)
MKAAGVKAIKEELNSRSRQELSDLCLKLSKFKKENKELLTYLLFEADNENLFIISIQEEIDLEFENINRKSYYFIKKSIRKILRNTKKNIRYSKKKQTEVELLLHFCKKLKKFDPSISNSIPLTRIFDREILKVEKILNTLHPDLKYDYETEIESILEL